MSKAKSFNKNFNVQDEYYTPSCLINCIIPDIDQWITKFKKTNKRDPIIWCPFDTTESKYVQIFEREGYKVVRSHLNDDKDFFTYVPDEYDIIISNPPFSKKLKVFERIIFQLKKPFVLLMNMMALNYQEIGYLFYEVNPKIQFIIPDKKVSFDGHTSSFCSGYVCFDFIEKTKFIHLENNNTNEYFRR